MEAVLALEITGDPCHAPKVDIFEGWLAVDFSPRLKAMVKLPLEAVHVATISIWLGHIGEEVPDDPQSCFQSFHDYLRSLNEGGINGGRLFNQIQVFEAHHLHGIVVVPLVELCYCNVTQVFFDASSLLIFPPKHG